MVDIKTGAASTDYKFHELLLTRSVLLAHPSAGKIAPGDVFLHAGNYASITHWEEVLCAAINPNESSLVAVISIQQPDGYSGIFLNLGSIEYVRFFIDWQDSEGFQPVGLTHFKICDAPLGSDKSCFPMYHVVSTDFDVTKYWESVMDGIQPTVRAVLSWNQLPEMDISFTPVFGNHIDSNICIDTESDLINLLKQPEIRGEKSKVLESYASSFEKTGDILPLCVTR